MDNSCRLCWDTLMLQQPDGGGGVPPKIDPSWASGKRSCQLLHLLRTTPLPISTAASGSCAGRGNPRRCGCASSGPRPASWCAAVAGTRHPRGDLGAGLRLANSPLRRGARQVLSMKGGELLGILIPDKTNAMLQELGQ